MIRYFFMAVLLTLLCSACTMSVLDNTPMGEEPVPQEQILAPDYFYPNLSLEEAQYWVTADLEALYYCFYEENYLEYVKISPEEIDQRRLLWLSQDVPLLLDRLWSEYPQEECLSLAKEVMEKFYYSFRFRVVSVELIEESTSFALVLEYQSLLFPDSFTKEYIQENFDFISQNVQMSSISQENYLHYDNIATQRLLRELLRLESFSYGELETLELYLDASAQGYYLNDLSRLHNQLLKW